MCSLQKKLPPNACRGARCGVRKAHNLHQPGCFPPPDLERSQKFHSAIRLCRNPHRPPQPSPPPVTPSVPAQTVLLTPSIRSIGSVLEWFLIPQNLQPPIPCASAFLVEVLTRFIMGTLSLPVRQGRSLGLTVSFLFPPIFPRTKPGPVRPQAPIVLR